MNLANAASLAEVITHLDLVPAGPLADALNEVGESATAEELGKALVRREVLTGFQLERILKGHRDGYRYGRAKLLYQVGSGSFSRVYRAIDVESGDVLAVKVLRNRYSSDQEKCLAFQREGEMGRHLQHPSIVGIRDVGQEGGASYITMEFVEGQTIRELVKLRGALDVPMALDLIHQMASGLDYAHRRGVTHRDLKPSNVIISSTGRAKLVDFGLACVDATSEALPGNTGLPRTVDYYGLEQLTGVKDDSIRSDIYFLGTIAYLAVAGVSPLKETRDRNERSEPRRFTQVVPLAQQVPKLPREVADFIGRMMSLEVGERWQTAAEVKRRATWLKMKLAGAPLVAEVDTPSVAHKASVMLVESSARGQELLRTFFQDIGYRVLVTESPERALTRFSSVPYPADCLVISAHSFGDDAVAVFNKLSADPYLAEVPAILLADSGQGHLEALTQVDERRRFVRMPIRKAAMAQVLKEITSRGG